MEEERIRKEEKGGGGEINQLDREVWCAWLGVYEGEFIFITEKVWRMTHLRFLIKLELVNTMPEVYRCIYNAKYLVKKKLKIFLK